MGWFDKSSACGTRAARTSTWGGDAECTERVETTNALRENYVQQCDNIMGIRGVSDSIRIKKKLPFLNKVTFACPRSPSPPPRDFHPMSTSPHHHSLFPGTRTNNSAKQTTTRKMIASSAAARLFNNFLT